MKSTYTTPEVLLADALDDMRLAYAMHDRSLPGSPDIVFTAEKMVVFVHGCYWHRHAGCHRATIPKTDTLAWIGRFQANVERDQRVARALREDGWWVYVAWECDVLRRPLDVAEDVQRFLNQRSVSIAS